jgi:hypothetical protein
VDDPLLVGSLEGLGDLLRNWEGLIEGNLDWADCSAGIESACLRHRGTHATFVALLVAVRSGVSDWAAQGGRLFSWTRR